jgi:hypothetical protein
MEFIDFKGEKYKILCRGMAGASAIGGVDCDAWLAHRVLPCTGS